MLREVRDKESMIEGAEWELTRELRLRAETKLVKAKVETEIDKIKRENAELKDSIAVGETLRIKQQEIIAQYEFENRERDRALALKERGDECFSGGKIADAVKHL